MSNNWRYTLNTFEINTRVSRPIAYSFFTDYKAKLEAAGGSDPEINVIHTDFVPYYESLRGIYQNLMMVSGEYEGRTLGFEELLTQLNDTDHLRRWEGKIRAEFPEDSPTEREIFPDKRKPFQSGTYENRVLTVGTLAQKLLEYPALATTQAEVLSFYNLMESTREAQQNHEGTEATLRVLFENQRVITADETFGGFGRLCYKFRNNRSMIATFFDLEILTSSDSGDNDPEPEPEPITDSVNGTEQKNVLGPANPQWVAGATVTVRNTTTTPAIGGLQFYPANSPGDGWDGSGPPLNPGEEFTFTINAPDFKPYFNVYNPGPNTQSFEVSFD